MFATDHEPGIYAGIPMRDYHAAPAVNAHLLLQMIDRCPAAAFYGSWMNPERPADAPSDPMNAGTIAHALLLEGAADRVQVIDPFAFPSKTTGAIPVGWTNQAIRAARDAAYQAGKIPILKDDFAEIAAMVRTARAFIDSLASEEPEIYRAFEPDGGHSELSMLWDDAGTLCRIRPDRINAARTLVVDYKSTEASAEPNTWSRAQMIRLGYYTSAAFYRRGIRALCGTSPDYVFLVQEQTAPYLCSLVGMDEQAFALGAAKIDYGLTLWRKCVRAKAWPAYPARVCYPEIPPWESARWEETAHGIPYDVEKLWGKRPEDASA